MGSSPTLWNWSPATTTTPYHNLPGRTSTLQVDLPQLRGHDLFRGAGQPD